MRLKLFTFKRVLILGTVIAAIVCLLPTFTNTWPHKKINLGLDLQGGMHLVLEVENEKAVEAELERTIAELKKDLRQEGLKHLGITRTDNSILAKISGRENKEAVEKLLSEDYSNLEIPSTEDITDGVSFTLQLPEKEMASIKKMATEQALETIRNRIDEFGVSEPDLRIQGSNRILLQLPGIEEPDRAKKLIGKTALLTFKLVNDEADITAAINGNPPVGSEILYKEIRDKTTGTVVSRTPYLIKKQVLLDGSQLVNARVEFDQFQQPQVGIEFSRKGARIFDRITDQNVNKRLAIVLDNKVYSAPNINERIAGGKASISGQFSLDEAKDLAIALRAGSLPAPVHIIEERTVGPTLGKDSVDMGLMSMMVGGALVILFMAIYYKGAGCIADLALIVNIILIGGGLAAFGATLTLPGIAGIILTIGMAVDANVIIFERIREELRSGKTPLAAVHAGYDRATLTILDANVTTLIAAAVLFQFGTGAVQGFALTLGLGIMASLFTALILSKSLYDFILQNKQSSTLSI